MVNHVRTLLLNIPSDVAEKYSAIYVPKDFVPIDIPAKYNSISFTLFPPSFSVFKRICLVDCYCSILNTPELYPYLTRFDNRITYSFGEVRTLLDLYLSSTMSEYYNIINNILTSTDILINKNLLFTSPFYQDDLDKLFKIWLNPVESLLKIGSVLLAYSYQLETIRQGKQV